MWAGECLTRTLPPTENGTVQAARMSDVKPSTSVAVHAGSVVTRPGARGGVVIRIQKAGLAFAPVTTETCPACQARPATLLETFHLRRPARILAAIESPSLPAAYLLAALVMFAGHGAAAAMVFAFAPALTTGMASLLASRSGKRARCKVRMCPACAANLRHTQQRVGLFRRLKSVSTWALVMLGPSVLDDAGARHVALGAALCVASLVAWVKERGATRDADALQPALVDARSNEAMVRVPAAWEPVLRREQPGLLPEG